MTNLVFENIKISENYDPMVDLKNYPFVLAPMYFDWGLSKFSDLWVRKEIADKLQAVQEKHLDSLGKKFKIWDPWRSRVVQDNIYQKFWQEMALKNPEWGEERLAQEVGVFVTKADDKNRIPPHATGGAIDLTVVEEDGAEVDFGTMFDHFGSEAATNYFENNDKNNVARDNRRWFHKIMIEEGFETDHDEWWHFDFGNQKWAVQSNKLEAFYGEVTNPVEFNKETEKGTKYALT